MIIIIIRDFNRVERAKKIERIKKTKRVLIIQTCISELTNKSLLNSVPLKLQLGLDLAFLYCWYDNGRILKPKNQKLKIIVLVAFCSNNLDSRTDR